MRKLFFQFSLSLVLLVYFATQVDWNAMLGAMAEIIPGFYILSSIIALCGPIILSAKYRLLIAKTDLDLPFMRLVAINYMARFYSLLLPTSLGSEAVRWYKITRDKKGKVFFGAATIVERLLFLLVLFMCGSIPLLMSRQPAIQELATKLLPIICVISSIFVLSLTYFLWPWVQLRVQEMLMKLLRLSQQSKFVVFLENFSLKNTSVESISMLLLYTLIWQLFFLFRMYFLFLSLNLSFSFLDVTWMCSLVMLLQVLPISYSGLGVREGAYAFLFLQSGEPSESGVLVGILFFSQMLMICMVGWIFQILEKKQSVLH